MITVLGACRLTLIAQADSKPYTLIDAKALRSTGVPQQK